MNAFVDALRDTPDMRSLDVHLAQFAASLDHQENPAILVATALASRALGLGDVCTRLEDCVAWALAWPDLDCPKDASQWRTVLQSASAVSPGNEEDSALLVIDASDRIYLMRYYSHEQFVAQSLKTALSGKTTPVEPAALKAALDTVFPSNTSEPDWQRLAVAVAVRQRFCVISGGPGTGKTRTVASLLCLLQYFAEEPLRMALTAPTGKAAARLAQSIQRELPKLTALFPKAAETVPSEASTLHRLLGYRSDGQFRHNARQPLALDLLLVDEASMLDLAMMARLLDAVAPSTRLILLGDRDQLASVEVGNVLGDICGNHFDFASAEMLDYLRALEPLATEQLEPTQHVVADGICLLRRSYRFDDTSSVGKVSRAINQGDWASTKALLRANNYDLEYFDSDAQGHKAVTDKVVAHFKALLACESPQLALKQLSRFQLLCCLRMGAAGVQDLNERMAQLLRRAGVIASTDYFKGRPVMVVQNDYSQGLYNGDVGLLWPDEQGDIQAWFDDGLGGLRSFLPARLPEHESCFAMTVHKTQGSEFHEICLFLPEHVAPILTRQLLYTGVTRAREKVSICGPKSVVKHMVSASLQRHSGLADALNK